MNASTKCDIDTSTPIKKHPTFSERPQELDVPEVPRLKFTDEIMEIHDEVGSRIAALSRKTKFKIAEIVFECSYDRGLSVDEANQLFGLFHSRYGLAADHFTKVFPDFRKNLDLLIPSPRRS